MTIKKEYNVAELKGFTLCSVEILEDYEFMGEWWNQEVLAHIVDQNKNPETIRATLTHDLVTDTPLLVSYKETSQLCDLETLQELLRLA